MIKEFQDFIRSDWYSYEKKKGGGLKSMFIMTVGLAGESGEVCELIKKNVRDGKEIKKDLLLELGDVLHYLTRIGQEFNMSLEDIMQANIIKLKERRKNNPDWKG